MGDRCELSVVIVSHRCRDHLRRCLADLGENAATVDMDVHVVDTASGDGTADVADGRRGVVVTRLATNVGFARANNLALPAVRGRAVLFLNPDTRLPAGTLRACLDELWRRPEVGVLTPRVVDAGGRFDPRTRRALPTPLGVALHLAGLDRRLAATRCRTYTRGWLAEDRAAAVPSVSGAFMLCRREVLVETGGFDERYFMYAEDIDLCLRAGYRGWRVRYWPGASIVHVGGGSGAPAKPRHPAAQRAWCRSTAPLVRTHRPGPGGRRQALVFALAGEAVLAGSRLPRIRRS